MARPSTRAVILSLTCALVGCGTANEPPGSKPPPSTNPGGGGGSGGSGGAPPGPTADASPPADSQASPTPPATDGAGAPVQRDGATADSRPSDSGPRADAAPNGADAPPSTGMDPAPERPLMVDKTTPQLFSFTFRPSEADPAASDRNLPQLATLDTRVPQIRGKLAVVLAGVNGAPGPTSLARYTASLGFHTFAVAYKNDFNPSTQNDPAFFGDARLEAFDGMDRTPRLTVSRADCVEVRVVKALEYLQGRNAAGDWAYFLGRDGQVRWSDVIFIGHSHGASSAAAYAKIRRLHRAISMAGPRDTNPVVASWLTMPSATPIDRYFGFTGTGDGQYRDHLRAMEAAGYLGAAVDVSQASPPYQGSHRLQYPGGHGDAIDCARYNAACRHMLGLR